MGNIVLLDDLTINKIAAGEVIERPASVVKEMVENSIDAGATNINIEIKNGGISYIRITDNGKGIMQDDMEIAFERHATSKIRSADDLEMVKSMGFRGEALASIAAIARVEMTSKTKESEMGYKVIVEGGNIIDKHEEGCPNGTSITVENLFYNTPVRYKFLKKDFTEAGYIEDVVTRIALINPDVAIKLVSSGKTIIQTSGTGDMKSVIYNIYGKDIAENILNVNYNYEDIKIVGVVGKPSIARSNRSNQLFFVNKRYIKDKTLTGSAEQAFKGMITIGKFGFLVLNLEINPQKVDVNVHPAKLEVRFEEEGKVFKAVYHAIKDTLLKGDLVTDTEKEEVYEDASEPKDMLGLFQKFREESTQTTNNSQESKPENTKLNEIMSKMQEMRADLEKQGYVPKNMKDIIKEEETPYGMNIELNRENISTEQESTGSETQEGSSSEIGKAESEGQWNSGIEQEKIDGEGQGNSGIEQGKLEDEGQGNSGIEQGKLEGEGQGNSEIEQRKLEDEGQGNSGIEQRKLEDEGQDNSGIEQEKIEGESQENTKLENLNNENNKDRNFDNIYDSIFGRIRTNEKDDGIIQIDAKPVTIQENVSMFEGKSEYNKQVYKFIGIAFSTYIMIEMDKELYIIDQHAAHERILYEKVKENYYSDEKKESQLMLLPDIITLTNKEMGIAKDNMEMFRKAGFELDEFGENTIKLTGVPNICIDLNTRDLFLETLDEINTVARTAKQEIEEKFIATVACKAAVKANMALTKEEVDSLMEELLVLPNPFTCPHGRPTAIKMTKTDIEKKFSRR